MSQRLTLSIDNCLITAGYKNQLYKQQFGFAHYGFDLVSASGNRTVRACGEGGVVAAGMDSLSAYTKLGNCIVIVYRDVLLPDGTTTDLACRMFHFDSLTVKAGDKVTRDTILGQYGNTGGAVLVQKHQTGPSSCNDELAAFAGPIGRQQAGQRMGYHLHIEFDKDVQWPAYAVGIASSGEVIQRGTVDSTLSPTECWWLGDEQTIGGKYSVAHSGHPSAWSSAQRSSKEMLLVGAGTCLSCKSLSSCHPDSLTWAAGRVQDRYGVNQLQW